ncbi:helix-turn-helix domain-containing protein [Candidatus Contubernalis alkalaceticus]|nr:helix-turn-helix domain-containing protein [Candidatus Contubernalis alkalaceticus]UNC92397.1 helix-turn-helix domain-containing protein [Candidatus Contubernalis alkalaceticus]
MQEYFTPQEVSKKLKVDVRTVYRWIKEGKLKALKAGKGWRIPESELTHFLEGK